MRIPAVLLVLAWLPGGCLATPPEMPSLATARVSTDFSSYDIQRVGMMPFAGRVLDGERAEALDAAFFAEISRTTPYELVPLHSRDLEEVRESEPYRRGWYRPETIIAISRRYSLDAIFFGTVTKSQFFPPQHLSVQLDLVAAETGLVIWSSSVHIDANEPSVREGLQVYFGTDDDGNPGGQDWRVALLSPARFARFAAFQIAALL